MITVGAPPYLECSSKGDKRFSAFYAKPKSLRGKSIEEAYQAMKVLYDGSTNLPWRRVKGKKPINLEECQAAYTRWWKEWVQEQGLMHVLKAASGLSDVFGQPDHVCQALVLWGIRNGN